MFDRCPPKFMLEHREDKVTTHAPFLVISSALGITCNHLRPCLLDCYAILAALYPTILKGGTMTVLPHTPSLSEEPKAPDKRYERNHTLSKTLKILWLSTNGNNGMQFPLYACIHS